MTLHGRAGRYCAPHVAKCPDHSSKWLRYGCAAHAPWARDTRKPSRRVQYGPGRACCRNGSAGMPSNYETGYLNIYVFIIQPHKQIMYFMYADASGNPSAKDSAGLGKFYIISGIIILERHREHYCKLVTDMKKTLLPNTSLPWELHAAEIWNGSGRFKSINEKKRNEIFQRSVELISRLNVSIITVVIPKDIVGGKWKSGILKTSWIMLVERFEQYLDCKRPTTNAGLICADMMGPGEKQNITSAIDKFAKRGTRYQPAKHVAGCVDFLDSDVNNFIQLADVVAYITHKYHKRDPQFQDWYETLKLKTYKTGYGSTQHDIRLHMEMD